MIKKIDTHLHGKYSSDSVIDYRKLCQKAIERNYQAIAFTEHYDLIDTELIEYGLLPIKRYVSELAEIKKEFIELEIITGIELGEPHIVKERAERLLRDTDIEYIVGSLHVTRSGNNVSLRLEEPLSDKDILEYYEENLEMVKIGGFDTLGHLGIYKRGLPALPAYSAHSTSFMGGDILPDESCAFPIIDEIFRVMIKNNICLEVNISGFKARIHNHIPEPDILQRYKKLGGNFLTICSDSHALEHFDRFYEKTLDNLRQLGFLELHWKKRSGWQSIKI